MSSRSSISWVCTRAFRSIVSSPFSRSAWSSSAAAQDLRPAEDRVERRAQLVRQRRQELVLDARSCRSAAAAGRALALEQRLRSSAACWAASYSRALSMAMPACAATPTTRRSARSVKTSGSGWPKNSPPITSPEPGADRHRQVAAHRQVPLRHAVVRRHRAVARVLPGRRRSGSAPRRGRSGRTAPSRAAAERLERLPRRARERVEQERVALLVGRVVEERAELGAAQLRRGVGDAPGPAACRSSCDASVLPVSLSSSRMRVSSRSAASVRLRAA